MIGLVAAHVAASCRDAWRRCSRRQPATPRARRGHPARRAALRPNVSPADHRPPVLLPIAAARITARRSSRPIGDRRRPPPAGVARDHRSPATTPRRSSDRSPMSRDTPRRSPRRSPTPETPPAGPCDRLATTRDRPPPVPATDRRPPAITPRRSRRPIADRLRPPPAGPPPDRRRAKHPPPVPRATVDRPNHPSPVVATDRGSPAVTARRSRRPIVNHPRPPPSGVFGDHRSAVPPPAGVSARSSASSRARTGMQAFRAFLPLGENHCPFNILPEVESIESKPPSPRALPGAINEPANRGALAPR